LDPLSQILKLLRLRGCVYFNAGFRAPWGMTIPKNDAAQFHLIIQGACRVTHNDQEHLLSTGDVIVFPHGDYHQLYDGEPVKFLDGQQVVEAISSGQKVFISGLRVTTQIICGHFEFDRSIPHPFIANLPDYMMVRGFDQELSGASFQLSTLLLHEQEHALAGSDEIITRLAESLFIQILRVHIQKESTTGLFAAFNDQRLRKALEIIHSNGPDELTLDALAKKIGMSRSNLAARFKETVGQTPMKYLSEWQLLQARNLLESTDKPIAIIAEESGYRSEAAFSRAFKMFLGTPPSVVRRKSTQSRAG